MCSADVSYLLTYFNESFGTVISQSTGPIFARFSGLVEIYLQLISLKLVFRSGKGRCHGNQILLALSIEGSFGDIR